MSESFTPRTDAIDVELLRFNSGEHYGLKVVSDLNHGYLVEHARQLERELALAKARIAELEKALRGVLAEADRDTDSFIFARRILKDRP